MRRRSVLQGLTWLSLGAMTQRTQAETYPTAPLIIAHRGASGYLPEHTLEAYRRAHELGADVIEPDLVFTKDGHLICRHDRYLSTSTNVADMAVFKDRKTRKPGDGKADWFAEDFTLDEIKSLKARQAFPGRSKDQDDQFAIPTFDELLALAKAGGWRLYPEAKDPASAQANGHDFMAALGPFFSAAATGDIGPSFLQCFDPGFLKPLKPMKNVQRIQLLYQPRPDLEVLQKIAQYADGVGPNKGALVKGGVSSGFVETAHAHGLTVHPWTFRTDALPSGFDTTEEEFRFFFDLGVDGVFTDFTGEGVEARARWSRDL